MADREAAPSLDGVANEILTILGEDDPRSPPNPEREGDDGDAEATPEEAADAADPAADTEAETPIQAPASWKADAKERFKDLPPALQRTIVERERERESHFSKTQQDAARARKVLEAERQAVQQERRGSLDTLSLLSEAFQTLDPVLAEGAKTDWQKLSREDPAAAQAKWAQYRDRLQALQAVQARRAQAHEAAQQEGVRHAHRTLQDKLPFWNDAGRRGAFLDALDHYLHEHGFTPAERRSLADPRAILVAREAMLYRQLMAQQAQIAARRRGAAGGRVLRSQASTESREVSGRAQALAKRAARTGRLDDQAAAILAALD
jgi:hypothetical protein